MDGRRAQARRGGRDGTRLRRAPPGAVRAAREWAGSAGPSAGPSAGTSAATSAAPSGTATPTRRVLRRAARELKRICSAEEQNTRAEGDGAALSPRAEAGAAAPAPPRRRTRGGDTPHAHAHARARARLAPRHGRGEETPWSHAHSRGSYAPSLARTAPARVHSGDAENGFENDHAASDDDYAGGGASGPMTPYSVASPRSEYSSRPRGGRLRSSGYSRGGSYSASHTTSMYSSVYTSRAPSEVGGADTPSMGGHDNFSQRSYDAWSGDDDDYGASGTMTPYSVASSRSTYSASARGGRLRSGGHSRGGAHSASYTPSMYSSAYTSYATSEVGDAPSIGLYDNGLSLHAGTHGNRASKMAHQREPRENSHRRLRNRHAQRVAFAPDAAAPFATGGEYARGAKEPGRKAAPGKSRRHFALPRVYGRTHAGRTQDSVVLKGGAAGAPQPNGKESNPETIARARRRRARRDNTSPAPEHARDSHDGRGASAGAKAGPHEMRAAGKPVNPTEASDPGAAQGEPLNVFMPPASLEPRRARKYERYGHSETVRACMEDAPTKRVQPDRGSSHRASVEGEHARAGAPENGEEARARGRRASRGTERKGGRSRTRHQQQKSGEIGSSVGRDGSVDGDGGESTPGAGLSLRKPSDSLPLAGYGGRHAGKNVASTVFALEDKPVAARRHAGKGHTSTVFALEEKPVATRRHAGKAHASTVFALEEKPVAMRRHAGKAHASTAVANAEEPVAARRRQFAGIAHRSKVQLG